MAASVGLEDEVLTVLSVSLWLPVLTPMDTRASVSSITISLPEGRTRRMKVCSILAD